MTAPKPILGNDPNGVRCALAKLRDGTLVLGCVRMGWPEPLRYANRTQAQEAARIYGGTVLHRGRPFYVAIDLDVVWAKYK